MQCPKCLFEHDDGATECPKCGIVFAKFAEHQKFVEVQQKFEKEDAEEAADLRQELTSRFLALPIALMQRYVRLAAACLVALAILYVIGILRTRAELCSYKHR